MKIIIVGGGKVGTAICKELEESCDIVLIDHDPEVIEKAFSQFDIQAVVGNGADVNIQREATVEDADIFLAVTASDELNMISCIIAKELGVKHTAARVRDLEYKNSMDFIQKHLGITLILNPEEEAAKKISEILHYPSALNVETFSNKKVKLVSVEVTEDTYLNGITLQELDQPFEGRILVCIIERGDEVLIPKGDTKLEADDIIHITGEQEVLNAFYRSINEYKDPIHSALIIGGGKMSFYLLDLLEEVSMDIKIIEVDKKRALNLSERYPHITVIHGDGTDQDLLDNEGIHAFESCISLTGIDEENMIISIFAKHRNVKKAIAKVNRIAMLKLMSHNGLDTIVTPHRIIADKMVQFVRSLTASQRKSSIESLHVLADHKVEAIEFIAKIESQTLGIPLKDLKTLDNTLVILIIRKGEIIYPKGNDKILEGDKVLIVTTYDHFDDLDDMLVR